MFFPSSNITFIGFKIKNKKKHFKLVIKLNGGIIKGSIDPLSFE